MKRLLILLLVVSLMVSMTLIGFGCKEEAAEEEEVVAEEEAVAEEEEVVTINVLIDDREGHRKVSEELLPDFESMTGIDVNIELLPETEMMSKINIDLLSGTATYDVVMTGFMTEFAYIEGGLLEPLNDYIANKIDSAIGFNPGYIPESGAMADDIHVKDGIRYGMPLMITEIHDSLMYRADWLDEKGITLSDIPLTTEVEAAAAALTDKENGVYGWAMRGTRTQNAWTFCPIAEQYGATILNMDTFIPTVNEPEMVEALEWYTMMNQNYGPPDVANYGWYETMEALATGKVAMIQDADVLIYYALDVEGCVLQGKVGTKVMAQQPGYTKPVIGVYSWALSIPSSSTSKDAAWKFVQWFLTDDIARVATWATTPEVTKSNFDKVEVYPGEEPAFNATVENVENMSAEVYSVRKLPESAEIMDIFSAAVSASCSGDKEPQAALDDAYDEIYNLMDLKGYYE